MSIPGPQGRVASTLQGHIVGPTGQVLYEAASNQWVTTPTFAAGITGTGSIGTLTVPFSNLTGTVTNSQLAGPLLQSLTATNGLSVTNPSGVGSGSYRLVLNGSSLSNGSSGVSLNVGNANTWNAAQAFAAGITGSGSVGALTAPWGNLTSIPANVTNAASTATTNTFAAAQTFAAGITGSGTTGALTAGAGILNTANNWGAAQTVSGGLLSTTYNFGGVANWGSNAVIGEVSSVGTNPSGFFVGWNGTNANGEVDLIAFSPVSGTYPGQFAFWANPTLGSTTVHRVFTINANASVLTANNTLDNGSGASTTVGLATFNAGVQLGSSTPLTTAGTLSQEDHRLFLGNGSIAQNIPVVVASATTTLTTTNTTAIVANTPSTTGLFTAKCYLVVAASTVMTIILTYTDSGGVRTYAPDDVITIGIGGTMVLDYTFEAVAGDSITLTAQAGTANQVTVIAALVQLT